MVWSHTWLEGSLQIKQLHYDENFYPGVLMMISRMRMTLWRLIEIITIKTPCKEIFVRMGSSTPDQFQRLVDCLPRCTESDLVSHDYPNKDKLNFWSGLYDKLRPLEKSQKLIFCMEQKKQVEFYPISSKLYPKFFYQHWAEGSSWLSVKTPDVLQPKLRPLLVQIVAL